MESPGEPKTLSDTYHQIQQRMQGPREVKGLTQGHTAVRDRTGIQALMSLSRKREWVGLRYEERGRT